MKRAALILAFSLSVATITATTTTAQPSDTLTVSTVEWLDGAIYADPCDLAAPPAPVLRLWLEIADTAGGPWRAVFVDPIVTVTNPAPTALYRLRITQGTR